MTNGWQYGRKALECLQYMLDNDRYKDVCFEVGTTEDTIVRIRAHKFMLISRSEVFEAMFSSGMVETLGGPEAVIRIEDIEPKVFKEMLRFIYSDSADMTTISVHELMYAAKKYMLPNLVDLCSQYLIKDLTAENVCEVMNESLLFDESDLTQKCAEFVEQDPSVVLKPENLRNATRPTMEAIVRLDSLQEDETVIYEACVNWAKAQLKNHRLIHHPSDQQIREMLGNLVYDIRFPTMDAQAFVDLVAGSTILSYEEKSAILCYIISKDKTDTLKFNCRERLWQWKNVDDEHVVDRGGSIGLRTTTYKSGHDAIDVQTDRTILVTGLGLLPEKGLNGTGYTVDLEILKSTVSVFKMSTFVPCTGNSTPHKVLFTKPVIMEHGILYTIIANACKGKLLFSRDSCQPIRHTDNVTFTFSNTECRGSNATTVDRGQIPHIYFKTRK